MSHGPSFSGAQGHAGFGSESTNQKRQSMDDQRLDFMTNQVGCHLEKLSIKVIARYISLHGTKPCSERPWIKDHCLNLAVGSCLRGGLLYARTPGSNAQNLQKFTVEGSGKACLLQRQPGVTCAGTFNT